MLQKITVVRVTRLEVAHMADPIRLKHVKILKPLPKQFTKQIEHMSKQIVWACAEWHTYFWEDGSVDLPHLRCQDAEAKTSY